MPRALASDQVSPDPLALRDDLTRATELISSGEDENAVDYLAQFLTGVARSSHDSALEDAATDLGQRRKDGKPVLTGMARVAGLVQERLTGDASV